MFGNKLVSSCEDTHTQKKDCQLLQHTIHHIKACQTKKSLETRLEKLSGSHLFIYLFYLKHTHKVIQNYIKCLMIITN